MSHHSMKKLPLSAAGSDSSRCKICDNTTKGESAKSWSGEVEIERRMLIATKIDTCHFKSSPAFREGMRRGTRHIACWSKKS